MSGGLGVLAALWLGLAASGHCVLMCGGISGALALGTRRGADGRPLLRLLVTYQLGRIGGYALAGLLFGSIGAGLFELFDHDGLRIALRVIAASAFALAAGALLGGRGWLERVVGARLWRRLAPKARALFPVDTVARALGIGVLWGWMPCGFVYTVLLLALASFDPWRSAAAMVAFGLGTLPAMLAVGMGGGTLSRWFGRAEFRRAGAALLAAMSVATLVGPLIARWSMPVLGKWLAFDC